MSRARPLALLLLLAAAQPSCVLWDWKRQVEFYTGDPLPPPLAFRDGSLDFGGYSRVLALPLEDLSAQGAKPAQMVSHSLRDELMKLRLFDVVQPSHSDARLKPALGPKQSGQIDIATIIELGKRYGVDAVVFGTIDHYRPYQPPALGISVSMVDVHTAKIVWEVRDFVDATDKPTAIAMREFFDYETAYDQTVMGDDIMSTSPQWFARFASRRIAYSLAPPSSPASRS